MLRTNTLIRDRPGRREEQSNLQGELDGSSSNPHRDSSWYEGDARNDFLSISGYLINRHHVEPRVKLYVSRAESFPIPLKYMDVTRTTYSSLHVMLEKISKIVRTLLEIESCQIRRQVLQDSLY